jgi:hypothetical protein
MILTWERYSFINNNNYFLAGTGCICQPVPVYLIPHCGITKGIDAVILKNNIYKYYVKAAL